MRIETLKATPEIAEAVVARDAQLEAFTREYAASTRGGQIYTIPVVFHVIHKYGNENISREQILDGLDVLNATFRKQIPDTADIHPDFKPIHADCEIEFKLATKDPEGNCHSGINRIASSLTNSGDHRVKELVHWDPSMYLNVYIVSNAAGLAGHAVWPSDADTIPEWDGIVMSHAYMGRIGTSDQTRSVVFAHELGHYLNLHHIWGGNNVPDFYYLPVGQQANCNEDDLVDDTPNTIGWSSCNLNASSCGNERDNVQNAMDYSYCNVMFTEGQKARMRACLNSPIANRNNLWSPANLAVTGVSSTPELCGVEIDSDKRVVCPHTDNEIEFSASVFHIDADSILWNFEGGNPATSTAANPTVEYATSGSFDVSLTAYTNGTPTTQTVEDYINVLHSSSQGFPFFERFDTRTSLADANFFESSADADNRWELTSIAGVASPKSVVLDNWENSRLTVDELYGPAIGLSGVSESRLAFKYACTGKQELTSITKLVVQVSRNCESSWQTRLTLSTDDLQTAPAQSEPFLPTNEQWIQESINIPNSYLVDGFRYRFVFTSDGENRLFIDDINIDQSASIQSVSVADRIKLYPNPTTETLTIETDFAASSQLAITVFNVLGKEVLRQPVVSNSNQIQLDVSKLPTGAYFLQIAKNEFITTKRFIVN